METWRQKVGVLTMLLCLFMVLAAIWYCLFRFNLRTEGQEMCIRDSLKAASPIYAVYYRENFLQSAGG